MSVISIRNLGKSYGSVRAVDGISFDVPRGGITALLGGNGAGKTTTIAMMLGMLTPSCGSVRILGHDMGHDRYPALQRMNFSSPYVDLPRNLTVRQNLVIYGRLYGARGLKDVVARLAEELELADFLDRPVGRLSAGQQTRVSLAKALVNAPELLLLDEPTASLDPDMADRVRNHLDRYRRTHGVTILLASHNMREVERLCDDVLMMRRGRIVDRGTPQELVRRSGRNDMEEVFLDVARHNEGGKGAAA